MKFSFPSFFFQAAVVALVVSNRAVIVHGCVSPSDYQLPPVGPLSDPSPPGPHMVGLFAGFQAWTIGISQYETPIALRYTQLIDMVNWNCVAMYSEDWKDATTRQSVVLNTPSSYFLNGGLSRLSISVNGEQAVSLHTSDARLLCMVNAWATVVDDWVPEAAEPLMGLLEQFGYPDVQRGYDSVVDDCFDIEGDGSADADCLASVAESYCYTPSIMGAIAGRHMTEYARRDGWNMYGELNSDGTSCVANCRPYTDPTGYQPVSTPGNANGQAFARRWSPLMEDNGRGYMTRQEHVTPHIGFTAKTIVLTQEEYESRSVPDPDYNYDDEAVKVMERMAELDDTKKMLIEFFDDKIALGFACIGAVVGQGAPFEAVVNYALGFGGSSYDAVLLAWREKVNTDLVRPTTWIQNQMGSMMFETWGGPFQGIRTIPGINFEAYKRVMPHSEYVSGSGCICQAIYEFTDAWVEQNLGLTDSIQVPLPPFSAGSSVTEPGFTPSDSINVAYPNMLALRNACGDSRLDGGMHFEASVPASYDLCAGVGIEALAYTESLW